MPRIFNWKFVPEDGDHPETLLETASRIGWLKGVELLLDRGISPLHEKRIAYQDSPCALLWACKEGYVDVVKIMLDKSVDVECFHERKFHIEHLILILNSEGAHRVKFLSVIKNTDIILWCDMFQQSHWSLKGA